jgi:hypothetical protein
MTRFKLVSTALMVSVALATPVFAQDAIQEPGNYAFFHPDGDLLHAGSARPASDAMAMMPAGSARVVRHHMAHHDMAHHVAIKRADRYSAQ